TKTCRWYAMCSGGGSKSSCSERRDELGNYKGLGILLGQGGEYMAHEFEVTFGLVEGTKRPAVKWTSPDNVYPRSPWWAGRYGLPTGPRNGLWVLDLDRKGGKDGVA